MLQLLWSAVVVWTLPDIMISLYVFKNHQTSISGNLYSIFQTCLLLSNLRDTPVHQQSIASVKGSESNSIYSYALLKNFTVILKQENLSLSS